MLFLMCLSVKGFAKDIALSVDPLIGKNAAVIWWNQDKTEGKRLILSTNLSLQITQYNDSGSKYYDTDTNFVTGEYDWCLKRTAHKSVEGLYLYTGTGISVSADSFKSTNTNPETITDVSLGLSIPFGIEYNLVKSIPNFSVSIEARPSLNIAYREEDFSWGSDLNRTYTVSLKVTPQLFITYYFD